MQCRQIIMKKKGEMPFEWYERSWKQKLIINERETEKRKVETGIKRLLRVVFSLLGITHVEDAPPSHLWW